MKNKWESILLSKKIKNNVVYMNFKVNANNKTDEISWSSDWGVFEPWNGNFTEEEFSIIKSGLWKNYDFTNNFPKIHKEYL